MSHPSVHFVAQAIFPDSSSDLATTSMVRPVNAFKFKMNKEIIECVESDRKDLSNQNIYDSSYSEEDILVLACTVDDKYAKRKEFKKRLQFDAHMGRPADEIAIALIPEFL